MPISIVAAETAIEALAVLLRRAWEDHEAHQKEMETLKKEVDTLRGLTFEQRAMRKEDGDRAFRALTAAFKERDEALAKLAQVKGGE